MKRVILLFAMISVLCVLLPSQPAMAQCDEHSARLLGQLFYIANPYNELTNPSQLVAFVEQNAAIFVSGGSVMRCSNSLGQALISQGLNAFNPSSYNSTYGKCLEWGATGEMAHDVASSMNQSAVDTYILGQELRWLSQVIPPAAQGNWRPFSSTGTQSRLQLRQVWPLVEMMGQMDPSIRLIMDQAITAFRPSIEYQVAFLAIRMKP